MPSNVEIKARIHNIEEIKDIATRLSNSTGEIFEQCDTFFNVPNGRLKLREFQKDTAAQLIFYDRSNELGPKLSNYSIAAVSNPQELKSTLTSALGIKGEVRKVRTLFLIGQTRVHVDRVEKLGDFLEFEVVLGEDEIVDSGQKTAQELLEKFGLKTEQLIPGAYMDLILNKDDH